VIRAKWALKQDEDSVKWGERIAKGLASWSVTRQEGAAAFLAMSDLVSVLLTLKVTEPIGAKIEQITKRLVQVKAAKQALRRLEPKLINVAIPKA
jgi:hypothetical protein